MKNLETAANRRGLIFPTGFRKLHHRRTAWYIIFSKNHFLNGNRIPYPLHYNPRFVYCFPIFNVVFIVGRLVLQTSYV